MIAKTQFSSKKFSGHASEATNTQVMIIWTYKKSLK